MTIPFRRALNEYELCCQTASIGTTPVAASVVVPAKGRLKRTYAVTGGVTTGTTSIAVKINGGAETGTPLAVPAGSGGVSASDNTKFGVGAVNEGDVITFTPSGGTGASIPGFFVAVIQRD
jgi:hypothetical protein